MFTLIQSSCHIDLVTIAGLSLQLHGDVSQDAKFCVFLSLETLSPTVWHFHTQIHKVMLILHTETAEIQEFHDAV
jgi:hypothetical protein